MGDEAAGAARQSGSYQSRNNAQIAKPQRTTNQTSESQTSTSSRFIVRAASYAGLAASAVLGGADVLPQHLHPDLLLGANDLGFGATRSQDKET